MQSVCSDNLGGFTASVHIDRADMFLDPVNRIVRDFFPTFATDDGEVRSAREFLEIGD